MVLLAQPLRHSGERTLAALSISHIESCLAMMLRVSKTRSCQPDYPAQNLNYCRQYYGDLDTDAPKPLHYEDFKTPMEKGAVRLGIILLPNDLAHAAAEAASAVRAALPAGDQSPMHDNEPCPQAWSFFIGALGTLRGAQLQKGCPSSKPVPGLKQYGLAVQAASHTPLQWTACTSPST